MFDKKEFKEERRRLRKNIGEQLWHLRQARKLSIKELSAMSKIPAHFIESLELYGLTHLSIFELQWLASFYGKCVKVELVGKEDL